MKLFRRLYRLSLLILHVFLGAAVTLVMTRPNQPPGSKYDAISAWWRKRIANILGVSLHVHGRPVPGPVLIVANHISWLDIAVLGWIPRISFLSKAEVRHWPVLGWLAQRGGTLFIERGGHGSANRAVAQISRHLKEGRNILIFPEGTTSDGSHVQIFHPRLFAAAIQTETPIQPVALRYMRPEGQPRGTAHPSAPFIGDDTFGTHLWRMLGEPATRTEIEFLPPIEPKGRDRKTLARLAREQIARRIEAVEPPAQDYPASSTTHEIRTD